MQGLPASGKSTLANDLMQRYGNTVRINKDLLRTMLHFDRFTGPNEGKTRDAARVLAKTFLEKGVNVIIDDTNLNPGTLQSWKDLAKEIDAKLEYHEMKTPFEECLRRDAEREKSVGEHVIYGMALSSGIYQKPEKGIVICDLDGTLADISHRLHFVKNLPEGEKKNWKAFFEGIPGDTLRTDVADMLLKYEGCGHEVFLVSGRPDTYRDLTEAWLEKVFKGYKPYKALIMRRGDDKRPDTEVKQGIYESLFKDKYPIEVVIDDRPSVIRMWREQGLTVNDVGDGIEF